MAGQTTYPIESGVISQEAGTIGETPIKVLVIAQNNSASLTDKYLLKNAQITDIGAELEEKEVAADMLREFRVKNMVTQVDMLLIKDNVAAIAASGKFVFAGTATKAGTLSFHLGKYTGGNSINNREGALIQIPVIVGDTDIQIAAKLTAAVTNATDPLNLVELVTQSDTKTVQFDAINKGEVGNSYFLGCDGIIGGITVTVTGFTGGATSPVISETDLNTATNNTRYQIIVLQDGIDEGALKAFLSDREQAIRKPDYSGIGILGKSDSEFNLIAFQETINDHLFICVGQSVYPTGINFSGGFTGGNHAAQSAVASEDALRQTEGADISSIMSNQTVDALFGGLAITPVPYFNTKLSNLDSPALQYGFTSTEVVNLNNNGIMALDWNGISNQIVMSEGVTMVKAGQKFANYNDLLAALKARELVLTNAKTNYQQSILTRATTASKTTHVTRSDIIIFLHQMFEYMTANGLIDDSDDSLKAYTKSINDTLTLDYKKGKVSVTLKVMTLVQLNEFVFDVEISFQG